MMTLVASAPPDDDPLRSLRRLRARQAGTLALFAVCSVAGGGALFYVQNLRHDFADGVGWQCVVWGAIDLAFAVVGIVQCVRAAGHPPSPQAEVDEFAAAEKMLRTLRFSERLNWLWLVIGLLLLAWAAMAESPALAGHGVGVLIQGGYLFAFDRVYAKRYARLLYPPME